MDDIYDPSFVKGVFDRCSERYIAFSLICSLGFTERWRRQCVAAMPAPPAGGAHGYATGVAGRKLRPDRSPKR